jgi:hypothetical protein
MTTIGAVAVAMGIGFVILGIVGPKPNPSVADHAVTAGVGVLMLIGGARGARTKLVLGPSEVVVHNWGATHHVAWSDIETVTVEPRTGIRILRRDGKVIKVENPGPSKWSVAADTWSSASDYESAIRTAQRNAEQ